MCNDGDATKNRYISLIQMTGHDSDRKVKAQLEMKLCRTKHIKKLHFIRNLTSIQLQIFLKV